MRKVIGKRKPKYLKILPSEGANFSPSPQLWSILFVASLERWPGQAQSTQVLPDQKMTVSCGVSVLAIKPSRLASVLFCGQSLTGGEIILSNLIFDYLCTDGSAFP